MAFDPICGDGVGNAIREAILASAVIKATQSNSDIDALLAHYRTRLLAGFLKHLELCRQFYAARSGEWWEAELSRLDEGAKWCRRELGSEIKFGYRLRGFELEPISSAQTLS
jgi:flavin-dependent dehydrogenase